MVKYEGEEFLQFVVKIMHLNFTHFYEVLHNCSRLVFTKFKNKYMGHTTVLQAQDTGALVIELELLLH